MANVDIQTSQNVQIQYPLAGISRRIGAFLIDALIIAGYNIAITFSIEVFGWIEWDELFNQRALLFLLGAPLIIYNLLFEIFNNGQSPGKYQLNIRVIRLDGNRPTLSDYFLRWVFRIIDISMVFGGVALLTIAFTRNGQRLGDMAAGTTVVHIGKKPKDLMHEILDKLPSDYQPTYPQANRLKEKDVEAIHQALIKQRDYGVNKPVMTAYEKIKTFLNVETDDPPGRFLWTVIKDFYFITSK